MDDDRMMRSSRKKQAIYLLIDVVLGCGAAAVLTGPHIAEIDWALTQLFFN